MDPHAETPNIPITYKTMEAQIITILSSGDERAVAALVALVNALYALVSDVPGSQ